MILMSLKNKIMNNIGIEQFKSNNLALIAKFPHLQNLTRLEIQENQRKILKEMMKKKKNNLTHRRDLHPQML